MSMGYFPRALGRYSCEECGMTDWRNELEEQINLHGLAMKAISLRAGKGETFVRDMLKRDREPSAKNLEAVRVAVNDMIAEKQPQSAVRTKDQIPDLAIFGGLGDGGALSVIVGSDGVPTDPDGLRGYWSMPGYVTRGMGNLQGIYGFEVIGDSMEPTLTGGAVVFVDTNQSALPPDDLYAVDYGDGLVVKRMQLVPRSDRIMVISDNERYAPHDLHRSEVKVYGRVIGWFQWRG